MQFLNDSLATILILLPLLGAAAVMFTPTRNATRWTALGVTGATLVFALLALFLYDRSGTGYTYARGGAVQFVLAAPWIPALGAEYRVGMDGLSLPMVVLTALILLLAVVASWEIEKMTRAYMALVLLLEAGLMGTFLSLDLLLFYVFFEVTLLPMYFLIGVWGGPRKEYAAIKFFLYTLLGSIGLLIALIGTFLYSKQVIPGGTFDLIRLASPEMVKLFATPAMHGVGLTFFVLFMVGFLVKVPAVPVHTWLPDAHVEAPTPISMILAAVLLKMGGYGILRVAYPLFPEAAKSLWMIFALVGVVSILYGALVALSQTDFKRLVAYSSVSHMGYVVLGIATMTPAGVSGAVFMMVAHGIVSAMLFFVVGVIYDRAHHREMNRLGGLATTMPVYTGFSTVAVFANLGLPGLCGFIGEVMVIIGAFTAARPDSALVSGGYATQGQLMTIAVLACFGVVLTAAYMLWTLQRVFFGPERVEQAKYPEATRREILVLAPLALLAIVLGVLPAQTVFTFTKSTLNSMQVGAKATVDATPVAER